MSDSLKPEMQFELYKLVVLRESYLQKLAKKLKANKGSVEIGVIGLFDVLRQISIEVVDTIRMWERTQISYPVVKAFEWNGANYLEKMFDDLGFLEAHPQVASWLGFSLAFNPFVVPPDVFTGELQLEPGSFVVFGRRPDRYLTEEARPDKKPYFRSPYRTPIINDPEVFQHLSVGKQLERKFKKEAAAALKIKKRRGDEGGSGGEGSSTDPFESYLSHELVAKIRHCWAVLHKANQHVLQGDSVLQSHFSYLGSTSQVADVGDEEGRQSPKIGLNESVASFAFHGDGDALAITGDHLKSSASFAGTAAGVAEQQEEEFRRSKSQFYSSLHESSGANYQMMDARNKSLRMSQASRKSTSGSTTALLSQSQVWTPHEIHMQRQVQRRGGELFVLTAAGTQGRMKAPWRRSRFERMETDLQHMAVQSDSLAMAIEDLQSSDLLRPEVDRQVDREDTTVSEHTPEEEALIAKMRGQIAALKESQRDVDTRKSFMAYQHGHFKRVAEGGSLTDLEKQRRLHQLQDGQALDADERVAMSLEDQMAHRIQRRVRRAFGKALRKALMAKRHRAAMVLQGMWRRAQVHMMSLNRGKQLRLAIILQRLYRGSLVGETMRQLKREAQERVAALNIQRFFRGYLGRKRLNLKREFVASLAEAQNAVSLRVLAPGDLEELADVIELFVRDYTLDMPPAVLTVLRAVLYMFNGDLAECVIVSSGGYTEKKYIKASIATWQGVKLILRRKGRVLRRLRALIKNSRLPNPSTLKFTADCATHLTELVAGVTEEDFEDLTRGRHCIVQLFRYCVHLKRAFDLQGLFPEYFDPGQPGWFRILLKLRTNFDRADMSRRVQSKCKFRLEEHKRSYAKEGKSWKPVGDAAKRNDSLLEDARQLRTKTKKRYLEYVASLEAAEKKKVHTLQGIERSRALGVEVALGDLKEYLRSCFIPDETILKDLHYAVDTKTISLLQTRADVLNAIESNERNEQSRDFDRIMRVKKLHDKCAEMGVIQADLLVLLNRWKALLKSIGGEQYVKDLVGAKKELYDRLKAQALDLMEQRRAVAAVMDSELQEQYAKVVKVSRDAGLKIINQHWDLPAPVEVSAEDEENRECCRRDADFELRQKRQTAFVSIPSAPFHPVMVLVDARIPRGIKDMIISTLSKYDYRHCAAEQTDPNLYNIFQASIDARQNIIFFANRGAHQIARLSFMTMFNSLLAGLIPRPHVVGVDCSADLHVEDWHSMFALDQRAMSQMDVQQSVQCDLSIGKARKIAHKFRHLLFTSKQTGTNPRHNVMPRWLRSVFHKDFQSFTASLTTSRLSKKRTVLSALPVAVCADVVLSAAIASIFQFWKAPLTQWRDEDVVEGCLEFVDHAAGLTNLQLCDLLSLKTELNTETVASRRLTQSDHLVGAWQYLSSLDFHRFPARYLLFGWVKEIKALLELLSSQGGQASSEYKNCEMAYVRSVDWKQDVKFVDKFDAQNFPGEQLVGDLLYECLRFSKIYENRACPLKFYYDRANLESTEAQSIGMTHSTQHVCVYQSGEETFVSVQVDSEKLRTEGRQVQPWKYFGRMKVKDIISMLQPNNTEIFEGKVKKYDIREGVGAHRWYELLAEWACLDNIGEKFQITLLRSRFLILSKIGQSNGYFIRLEVFEERFGEVRILIYGILPGGGAVNYLVDRGVVYELLAECDAHEEKDKLEALDTQSIAYIFSDRLEVVPSLNWQNFLASGELLPKSLERPVKVKLRKKRGPGRFVGRKVIKVSKTPLLVTIYEIDNETNSHELRVVLYEMQQCQTAEYRISPMERLMLFSDDIPLLDQICSRIRHVYCDPTEKTRRLLYMGEDFAPLVTPFEVEGDEEYDICSVISDHDEEDEEGHSAASGSFGVQSDDEEEAEDHSEQGSEEKSAADAAGAKVGNREEDDSLSRTHSKPRSNWRWAIYFNRSVVSEFKGNLVVSVGLSVVLGGFTVIVLDQRTYHEAYRFISFAESVTLLQDRTEEALQEELSNLDESTAFDLMDEVMAVVEVQDSDEEGLAVVLTASDSDQADDMIVARLKEHRSFVPDTLSRKRQGVPMQDVEINVYAAKELARNGTFGNRNPVAVVKWNMREVGRTAIIRATQSPLWEEGNSFHTVTVRDQQVKDCVLEVEIHDTDGKTSQLTEFLGVTRHTGAALVKLLEREARQWHELGKAKRLSEAEQRNVKGGVEISARKWEHVNQFVSVKKPPREEVTPLAENSLQEGSLTLTGDGRQEQFPAENSAIEDQPLTTQPSVKFAREREGKGKSSKNFSKPPAPLWERTNTTTLTAHVPVETPVIDALQGSELAPPQSFELSILAVESLPPNCEVVCTVKLNGVQVGELHTTSGEGKFMQSVAHFHSPPLVVETPAGYPVGGCHLQLEVRRKDLKELFGTLELRGSALDEFVQRSATHQPRWATLVDLTEVLPSGIRRDLFPASRIQMYASTEKTVVRKYRVNILAAQNITKADMFGKSDPYVKVYFNDELVGRTRHISNTLSPDWEGAEVFSLSVPVGRRLWDCVLEVELYDHDALSQDDFLGCRVVTGPDLLTLMGEADESADAAAKIKSPKEKKKKTAAVAAPTAKPTARGFAFALHRSEKTLVDQSLAVKGDIELSGCVDAEAAEVFAASEAAAQRYVAPEKSASLHVFEAVQNEIPLTILLNVLRATGLSKADTFGKSDPFVIARFNGRVVGQTRVVKNTLDPVWGEEEVLELTLPRGQPLQGCSLELEVFDADNLTRGDFLGSKTLGGPALQAELDRVMSRRPLAMTAFGEELVCALERSDRFTAKENELVKGDLVLRFAFKAVPEVRDIELRERFMSASLARGTLFAAPRLEDLTLHHSSHSHMELVVMWNSQEVQRFAAEWDKNSTSVALPASEFELFVPSIESSTYTVQQCVLQLMLHHDNNFVAAVALTGNELIGLTRSFHHEREKNVGQWFALEQAGRLNLLCLSGEVPVEKEPEFEIAVYNAGSGMLGPGENAAYPVITTDLTETDTAWRFHFPGAEELRKAALDNLAEEEKEAEVVAEAETKATDVPVATGGKANEIPRAPAALVVGATKGKTTQKMQLELAAMNFTVTVREILDDHRTCWRGRVMPKNFIAPDEMAKKAIMMSRSSRLIRMRNMRDMQVLAEVHYLTDLGDEEVASDLLPICVKEICTDGPGLVKRLYRVEVSANNGILMGSADIHDEEGDIRRLVGVDAPPTLLEGRKKNWRLGAIFEYVVRERLILDMMPHGNRKVKDGRRDGVMAAKEHHAPHHEHAADNMDVSGSLITLIRDPLPHEVLPSIAEESEPLPSGFEAVETPGPLERPSSPTQSADGSMVESMVATDKSVASAVNDKLNWIRIHTRTHRLTGKTFLSLVLLESTNRSFAESPDYYFKTVDSAFCLANAWVVFRCKDVFSKDVHELRVAGEEVLAWLPASYELDLRTKFRRDKFGAYLLQYLSLRFHRDGSFDLFLIKEEQAETALDDLLQGEELPAAASEEEGDDVVEDLREPPSAARRRSSSANVAAPGDLRRRMSSTDSMSEVDGAANTRRRLSSTGSGLEVTGPPDTRRRLSSAGSAAETTARRRGSQSSLGSVGKRGSTTFEDLVEKELQGKGVA